MQKFKAHKNCSCWRCRSGKTKKKTVIVERRFRHRMKQDLKVKCEDFENIAYHGDDFD